MARTSRQQFADALTSEHARTMRVLGAFPDEQSDFRPHERSRSAREVAWPLALGLERLIVRALTTGFDWSQPQKPPAVPERMSEIAAAVDRAYADAREALARADDARLDGSVQFFVAPKTMDDYPTMDFLWMILFDHVHHRGQVSVYLRMVGKVPAIYGPSGDEPWT
jgi:uncharacterized damage-inducible protein DinB